MQSIDLEVLQTARDWQQAGHRIWLVTVAQTFGASPRPPGSLLVIRDDGVLVGSVSGGCIEDDLVLRRGEYSQRQPVMVSYGVTSEEARRFGLPCGGTLDVLIEAAVPATDIDALLARITSGEIVSRHVDLASGAWTLERARPGAETTRGDAVFTAIHGPRWRMLVIGASEIARYLADMAAPLDFQVFVCDPRDEYRASWRVPGTAFIDGMPDDAVTAFRPDGHTIILTVSHDPKLDDMALLTALKSEAFYVGAVGSKQTTADRKARLAEHFDLTQAELARLHGPVGLPIGSRTPPEIAIAILADLVAARNRVTLARVEQSPSSAPALKRAS
ncbi:MAG: XdhC family protein [Betaproteobacteria bacterium]|nr:XdhC family protein [Betaproteobacteria bacterium]